nr:hypothetical protein [Microbacterium pseudoresistens]
MSTVAANESQVPMASLTKVVTVLTALDALPLGVGEQGPTFSFDDVDSAEYWQYREENQSSLDVPVDGVLTEYQLLQGILMGSANNYADRLSDEIWGSDRDFVAAGERWLSQRDLAGIELATPSGFAWDNIATARALVELGKIAVANPVIGEIVATQAVDLPGAGTVTNTNRLLGQPGYIGIKTGTIGEDEQELFNLLTAKEITVDGTTVRMFAAVVAQPDDASRYDGTAALYDEVEEALRNQAPTVAKGAVLGSVDTLWGEHVDVVAGDDARVVLWNGAAASGTTAFSLGDDWAEGAKAGTVTITGPLDSTDAELVLGSELHGPDFWWRLTHPLELFGLGAVTG